MIIIYSIGLYCYKNIVLIIQFVSTLEENGIFMLGANFLFSQFSMIEIIFFNKNLLYPIETIDFLK